MVRDARHSRYTFVILDVCVDVLVNVLWLEAIVLNICK